MIRYWVAAESGDERADGLITRIVEVCRVRATVPLAGRRRPEIREHVRSFPVLSYIVLYHPIPSGIVVRRIIHAARETKRALRDYDDAT